MFETSRGLTSKWSFSALLSFVEHKRDVGGSNDRASGLGDAVVMLRYSPVTISVYSKNAYYARALNESRGTQVYFSTSHTYNGENDRDYQSGHSTTAAIGGSYQTQTPWGFGLELFYRHAQRDKRNSVDIPNTGGQWLDVIPAVQYHVTDSLALKASAKIPVARNLNDSL